jgi:hypothetical protein
MSLWWHGVFRLVPAVSSSPCTCGCAARMRRTTCTDDPFGQHAAGAWSAIRRSASASCTPTGAAPPPPARPFPTRPKPGSWSCRPAAPAAATAGETPTSGSTRCPRTARSPLLRPGWPTGLRNPGRKWTARRSAPPRARRSSFGPATPTVSRPQAGSALRSPQADRPACGTARPSGELPPQRPDGS